MDPYSWLLLLICVILICLAAYFATSESAFAGINRVRIRNMAENGDKRAKLALKISDEFDRALTAILVGTNIVHIACASIATILAYRLFTGGSSAGGGEISATVTTVTTLVTTILIFMFGEMIPKSAANANSDRLALKLAPSLHAFMILLTPLTAIFHRLSLLLRRISGSAEEPTVTEDELSTIIETVEEEGVIDEEQRDLLQSTLEFAGTTVADVLTLWDDVSSLDLSMSADEILELIRSSKHSRLPVMDGERVVGILHIRNYLKAYISKGRADLRSLMTPPPFVPLDAVIDDLLEEMRNSKCYLSVAVDKNGKPMGLVTIEDFLEELVGEIYDEDDVVNPDFAKLGGNYFEVSGSLRMNELLDGIGYTPEGEINPSKTLHTFLFGLAGHLPEEEEEIVFEDLTFTVDEVAEQRVCRVTVKLETPELAVDVADEDAAKEEEQ